MQYDIKRLTVKNEQFQSENWYLRKELEEVNDELKKIKHLKQE